MRRIAALLFSLSALGAEVVDRVVVSFGLQVVTESAIRRQLRLESFFGQTPLVFDAAARRRAAEQLIDQALIRREVELNRFAPVSVNDTEALLEKLRTGLNLDAGRWAAALEAADLTQRDVEERAEWMLTLLRFVDFRFRPGVQVSDQEAQVYYDGEFAELARKSGTAREPFEKVRAAIVDVLAERKVNAALDEWLGQARAQFRIRYHEEALR